MIADDRHWQILVGNHAVFDCVAQVNDVNVRLDNTSIFRPGFPLVLLFDNLFVQNIDLPDHQEAQISDDVGGQVIVGNGVTIDVESKSQAASTRPVPSRDLPSGAARRCLRPHLR